MSERSRQLAGRSVLVTRAAGQADELIRLLEASGATVVHLPAIRFVPPPDWASLDLLIDTPEEWDWVVFTSTNGVAFFSDRVRSRGLAPAVTIRAKVVAVGAATADALRAVGIEPAAMPDRFLGTEILPLLPDDLTGVRTAIVRALEGRDELVGAIRAKGGTAHVAVAYETRSLDRLPDDIREALLLGTVDAMTFTSPSTVDSVLSHLSPEELDRVKSRAVFVSIGPTTTAALRARSIVSVAEAEQSSVEGLLAATVAALAGA